MSQINHDGLVTIAADILDLEQLQRHVAEYKEIAEKVVAALDVALATIKDKDHQIERLIEIGKDAIKLLEKRSN